MRSRTRAAAAATGLLAVLLLLLLASGRWSDPAAGPPPAAPALRVKAPDAPPAPEPVPPPPPRVESLRVVEVTGAVERRGANADWVTLSAGEALRVEDSIRTSPNGRAVLGVASGGRVEVMPRSQFSVRELSNTFARVRLDQGRLSAALPAAGGALRVETSGSDAAVEAHHATFVVMGNGHGQLAVAASEGSVRLSVGADSVVVHSGQQSETSGARPPAQPHAIPRSLFLKVTGPQARVQRERHTVIAGRSAPGAVISINGVRVTSDASGEFRAQVPLQDGRNPLVVVAEDLRGRTRRVALPGVTVKRRVGAVRAKVTWSREELEE